MRRTRSSSDPQASILNDGIDSASNMEPPGNFFKTDQGVNPFFEAGESDVIKFGGWRNRAYTKSSNIFIINRAASKQKQS